MNAGSVVWHKRPGVESIRVDRGGLSQLTEIGRRWPLDALRTKAPSLGAETAQGNPKRRLNT